MDQSKTSDTGSGMPVSALSADSRVESILVMRYQYRYLIRYLHVLIKYLKVHIR